MFIDDWAIFRVARREVEKEIFWTYDFDTPITWLLDGLAYGWLYLKNGGGVS